MPPSGGIFFCFGVRVRVRDKSGRGSGVYAIKHNTLCVGVQKKLGLGYLQLLAQKFLTPGAKKHEQLVTFLYIYVVLCGINIVILILIKISFFTWSKTNA